MSQTKTQLVEGLDLASAPADSLVIDSSGRLLVGTSSSTTVGSGSTLQVKGDGAAASSMSLIRTAAGGAEFHFAAGSSGTNIGNNHGLGFLKFLGYHTNGYDEYARIQAFVDGVNGDGDAPGRLSFATTADGAASPTERMRISSTGLHTITASNNSTAVQIRDASNYAGQLVTATDGTFEINARTTTTFTRTGSNTESMRIDSSGRVGIGTNSPTSRLHIGGNNGIRFGAGGTPEAEINYTAAGDEFLDLKCRGTNSTVGNIRFFTGNTASAAVEAMIINKFGRVGIGTSSPAALLHLADNNPHIRLEDENDNQDWEIIGSDLFRIRDITNSSADRFVINSSGQVGIGTTSPSAKLTITETSNANAIVIKNANSNGSVLSFGINTAIPAAYIQSANEGTGTAQPLAFYNAAGEMGRFDTSGRLLVGTNSGTSAQAIITNGLQVTGAAADGNTSRATLDYSGSTARLMSHFATGSEISFLTNPSGGGVTERMKILSNGVMQMGDPSGSGNGGWSVFVSDPNTSNQRGRTLFYARSTTAGGQEILQVFLGSSERLRIRADGNVQNANNSYGALSDIKLKENIVDAGSQWNDLKAIQVRKYNFKEGQTHTQIGVVAQEVELVSPGLVSESPDRDEDGNDLGTTTKSVNYSVLYMKSVKALQEAMERIETLEANNVSLEARLAALEAN